jgi:hypothetical protein
MEALSRTIYKMVQVSHLRVCSSVSLYEFFISLVCHERMSSHQWPSLDEMHLLESLIPLPYQPNDGGRRRTEWEQRACC